jgi:hypothetical protein
MNDPMVNNEHNDSVDSNVVDDEVSVMIAMGATIEVVMVEEEEDVASIVDQRQGYNSNNVPMGLSIRDNRAYG